MSHPPDHKAQKERPSALKMEADPQKREPPGRVTFDEAGIHKDRIAAAEWKTFQSGHRVAELEKTADLVEETDKEEESNSSKGKGRGKSRSSRRRWKKKVKKSSPSAGSEKKRSPSPEKKPEGQRKVRLK